MRKRGIILAAPKSGSGKTLVTCAMIRALVKRNYRVAAFKCGPDYIDPMFHEKVLGVPSKNLDLYFTGEEKTKLLFLEDNTSDISVIEGVMGLYDGLGGISEEASTYHLAKVLQLPVVLVINGRGMGRSVIAEIKGFLSMDERNLIKGVILNQISEGFYKSLSTIIEKELGISCLGYFPVQKDVELSSRYLGLKLPHEVEDLQAKVEKLAGSLEASVDLDKLIEISGNFVEKTCEDECDIAGATASETLLFDENEARLIEVEKNDSGKTEIKRIEAENIDSGKTEIKRIEAENIDSGKTEIKRIEAENIDSGKTEIKKTEVENTGSEIIAEDCIRIGVAKDEAFCFYYRDNLRMLEQLGARLIPFSPLYDEKLPDDLDGLLLGGGYPELKAKELSDNFSMRKSIKEALQKGMPSLAECGGFMYLHDSITAEDGCAYDMVGEVAGGCRNTGRLVRFGYAEFTCEKRDMSIKGHEFHYYDSDDCGTDCEAKKPLTGKTWSCMHVDENHWWGYGHLYYASNPDFPKWFVSRCQAYKNSHYADNL